MNDPRILTVWAMVAVGSVSSLAAAAEQGWSLASPDGQLVVSVLLTKAAGQAGYPAEEARLYYRIERGTGEQKDEVLPLSPLGIERADQPFVDALKCASVGEVQKIDETYEMPHGKRRVCHSLANQQALTFANAAGAKVRVILRAANDGIAFRYEFPETDATPRTVTGEATGFRLPEDAKAWIQPYQEPSKWTPAYEEYFQNGIPAGTASPGEAGWVLPALFHLPRGDRWVLLAEAATNGTYCGTRLQQKVDRGVYRIRFPQAGEGNGVGDVSPRSTLPWTMPWRVVLVGDSLASIVESTLITDLNPPSIVRDTAWIKPGRVSWSWWSDHDSSRDYEKLRDFVDLAAEMGWEYSLVDANWTIMDKGDVRQLAKYAASKGVGLLLWYNSGGPHNSVTEKPRDCLRDPEVRKFEFELLKQWGVKGVKIDFFQSDKQNIMRLYEDILEDAAAHKMLINFHGCTMPRGWSRTHPHLVTMEGVRGAECYTFAAEYAEKAPWHNTILPFTRNVVGPMDYTPVAFSNGMKPRQTTVAHELALSVVFESGWLHFADSTAAYRNLPAAPKDFLRTVPVAWDETRFVAGYPGKWITVARRKGHEWYLAGISGQPQPHEAALNLPFLGDATYTMNLITDGENGFTSQQQSVTGKASVKIRFAPRGGFVARLAK